MHDDRFFAGLDRVTSVWRDLTLHVPLRYDRIQAIAVLFRSPLEAVRELVPAGLSPLRWGRKQAVTILSMNRFLDCEIGPYEELVLSTPVAVGSDGLPYLGLRSFARSGGALFPHQMVVTTEAALDLGVEIAGYPKHIAGLDFDFDQAEIEAAWHEEGQSVLSVSFRRPELVSTDRRSSMDVMTINDGRLLRSTWCTYATQEGQVPAKRIRIEFGDHARASALRAILGGKCLGATMSARSSGVLSPPVEGWEIPT